MESSARVRNSSGIIGLLVLACVGIQFGVGYCHLNKPLPVGISLEGREHPVSELHFLRDLTYLTPDGERESE